MLRAGQIQNFSTLEADPAPVEDSTVAAPVTLRANREPERGFTGSQTSDMVVSVRRVAGTRRPFGLPPSLFLPQEGRLDPAIIDDFDQGKFMTRSV